MSTSPDLPLWVQDREEVLQNDAGVEWRGGKRPNYSMTNAHLEKEKKYRQVADSLEAMPTASFAIAYNLVRTFEMEASFKTDQRSGKPRRKTTGTLTPNNGFP